MKIFYLVEEKCKMTIAQFPAHQHYQSHPFQATFIFIPFQTLNNLLCKLDSAKADGITPFISISLNDLIVWFGAGRTG